MSDSLLSVRDLRVGFPTEAGLVWAVDGLSYELEAADVLGIVGESGSGKTVSCLAVLGLLPPTARVTGSIRFRGTELVSAEPNVVRMFRGARIAMVFQDALAALNPVRSVGDQIQEAIVAHTPGLSDAALRARVRELIDVVGLPDAAESSRRYPHELSGGGRQRVMIAIAIANEPDVLIADEPTTALDVTIQAQVLDVLERIQERTGSALLLITHDLGVVAGIAKRVLVMYAGRAVEVGDVDAVFGDPKHPYTLGLLASLPRVDAASRGRLYRIPGHPPSLVERPAGCTFHPRCALAEPMCATHRPRLEDVGDGRRSACHFFDRVARLRDELMQS